MFTQAELDEHNRIEDAKRKGVPSMTSTPRPWHIEKPKDEQVLIVSTGTSDRGSADVMEARGPYARKQANAALIIRAVNHHAALVKELEASIELLGSLLLNEPEDFENKALMKRLKQQEALLAKVKGV